MVERMSWSSVKSWFSSSAEEKTARFALPASVMEIEPGFVAGARFDRGGRGARKVRRMAVREFAPAAVQISFNRPNVGGSEEVARAVEAVQAMVGNSGGGVGLLVPDGAVRTMILGFEKLPDDREEADTLIRWRLRDRVPPPLEEIRISYQEMGQGPEGVELLVVAAKSSVLADYVGILGSKSGPPALVLPSTVALLPLVASDGAGSDLLVHLAAGWVTMVALAEERVCLWRSRPAQDDLLTDLSSEARRAAASVRDRQNVEVRRLWVCERPSASSSLAEELGKALSVEVRAMRPPEQAADRLSEPEKAVFQQYGAPVSGLLSNFS
jgi:hypothetical protein